ncbi:toll/interleukin-1 receptor domain-containing protein [Mycobacterium sp. MBM]|nr:toll/interleukin-1 receptor domain-containing protein [Mycobacterium sp. MBM]
MTSPLFALSVCAAQVGSAYLGLGYAGGVAARRDWCGQETRWTRLLWLQVADMRHRTRCVLRCPQCWRIEQQSCWDVELVRQSEEVIVVATCVFVSFKHTTDGEITTDFTLASALFDELTSRGIATFFSPVTLAASARSDYSRAIDEALDNAKVLVAVGSSRENLEASWVRYEWESFLNDQRSGVKPDAMLYSLTQGCPTSELPRALRQHGNFDATELQRLADVVERALCATADRVAEARELTPDSRVVDQLALRYGGFLRTPALNDLDDVARAYSSRGAATAGIGLMALHEAADRIECSGISLNFLCQQMSGPTLIRLVRRGCQIRALFLDPDCPAMAAREEEECHPAGKLRDLTHLNIDHLMNLKRRMMGHEVAGSLEVATTRETPRFSLTILDETLCIAQPYMPVLRGVDSPTFVLARRSSSAGLVAAFSESFAELWSASTKLLGDGDDE